MPRTAAPAPRTRSPAACTACSTRTACLLHHFVPAPEAAPPVTARLLERGEPLFWAGDPAEALYLVRSGALKSYQLATDGAEQVLGFHLPGDPLGLEAFAGGSYPACAVALETASVCRVPATALGELSAQVPALAQALAASLSQAHERLAGLLELQRKPAEQRIATFLLEHAAAQRRQGCSPQVLTLPMSRRDIGNYVGLALETVSRTLTRLQHRGLITVARGAVVLEDLNGLHRLAATPALGLQEVA